MYDECTPSIAAAADGITSVTTTNEGVPEEAAASGVPVTTTPEKSYVPAVKIVMEKQRKVITVHNFTPTTTVADALRQVAAGEGEVMYHGGRVLDERRLLADYPRARSDVLCVADPHPDYHLSRNGLAGGVRSKSRGRSRGRQGGRWARRESDAGGGGAHGYDSYNHGGRGRGQHDDRGDGLVSRRRRSNSMFRERGGGNQPARRRRFTRSASASASDYQPGPGVQCDWPSSSMRAPGGRRRRSRSEARVEWAPSPSQSPSRRQRRRGRTPALPRHPPSDDDEGEREMVSHLERERGGDRGRDRDRDGDRGRDRDGDGDGGRDRGRAERQRDPSPEAPPPVDWAHKEHAAQTELRKSLQKYKTTVNTHKTKRGKVIERKPPPTHERHYGGEFVRRLVNELWPTVAIISIIPFYMFTLSVYNEFAARSFADAMPVEPAVITKIDVWHNTTPIDPSPAREEAAVSAFAGITTPSRQAPVQSNYT
eukprot:gene35192-17693_t